jgi:hypothetical protein
MAVIAAGLFLWQAVAWGQVYMVKVKPAKVKAAKIKSAKVKVKKKRAKAKLSWRAIPAVAGVECAPHPEMDLFRYRHRYYGYDGGRWYEATHYPGPWRAIVKPPGVFHQIGPAYFKTPPGWCRGKKTGWRGAPLPPGQMKKLR